MKLLLSTLNAKFIHSSLALRSLRQSVRLAMPHLDVQIAEFTINSELLKVVSDIYRLRPAVLGLACYVWNISMTLQVVGLIRKVLPECMIILGGPEVSFNPEYWLERCPAANFIVLGEAEETLVELMEAIEDGTELEKVPGIAFSRSNGTVAIGSPQVVADLNRLPIAYEDADWPALDERIIYYEATRGCPYSCQYCLSGLAGSVRFRDLERVYGELVWLIAKKVKQIKFVDRTFNARKEFYFPIMKFLASQDCETNFHFEITADTLDQEVIAFLKTVPPGRFQFEIGVQSTHEPALQAIRRNNHWDRLSSNVRQVRAQGNIHLHLDLIAGLPFEGMREFYQSFDDVYDLQPHMLQLGFLKLLRGSGIRREAVDHDYVYMEEAPYEVLCNRYLSFAEVLQLKDIETMLDLYYNCGRFPKTLRFLGAWCGSPHQLYLRLAQWWISRGLDKQSHSIPALYGLLGEFADQTTADQGWVCREWLKFDVLSLAPAGMRPEALNWVEGQDEGEKAQLWRDGEKVKRAFPQYQFTNWREVKRIFPIQTFAFNAADIAPEILAPLQEPTTIVFNRSGNQPDWRKLPGGEALS